MNVQGQDAANKDPKVLQLAKQIEQLQEQKKSISPKADVTGNLFVERDELKPFVGQRIINLVGGIRNNIIGRPSCVDLVSGFIVPDIIKQSQPMVINNTPDGFSDAPFKFQQFQEQVLDFAEITPRIEQNIKNYMEKDRKGCIKGACNVPRVDTLIKKVRSKILGEKLANNGKFLNVSTGQYKMSDKTVMIYVGDIIPGDKGPLQLSIQNRDMKIIIDQTSPGKIPENQIPLTNTVFKRIEEIIRKTMGTTTQKVETMPQKLDVKTIRDIPVRKPSISKKEITMVRPLNEVVRLPLEGVAGIVDVRNDTERCIPSLTVKKRGLK